METEQHLNKIAVDYHSKFKITSSIMELVNLFKKRTLNPKINSNNFKVSKKLKIT